MVNDVAGAAVPGATHDKIKKDIVSADGPLQIVTGKISKAEQRVIWSAPNSAFHALPVPVNKKCVSGWLAPSVYFALDMRWMRPVVGFLNVYAARILF